MEPDPEDLIEAVRRRPVLYDRTDRQHSNRHFVAKQWQDVAKELGLDSENDVKRKWANLRDYFSRQNKWMHSSYNKNPQKRRWYLFDKLTFLLPHIKNLPVPSGGLENDEEEEEYGEEDLNEDAEETDPTESFTDRMTEYNTKPLQESVVKRESRKPASTSGNAAVKRKYPRYFEANFDNGDQNVSTSTDFQLHMIQLLELMSERLCSESKGATSDDDHFFQSLIPYMKMLDPVKKMECQGEIHSLVLSYVKQADNTAKSKMEAKNS